MSADSRALAGLHAAIISSVWHHVLKEYLFNELFVSDGCGAPGPHGSLALVGNLVTLLPTTAPSDRYQAERILCHPAPD